MKLLTFLVCLFITFSIKAQTTFMAGHGWLQTPEDFVLTQDNGYLIGGQMRSDTISSLIDECALLKIDSIGNGQWLRLYFDFGHDSWIRSVSKTTDGNYLFCGYPDGTTIYQSYIVKVDPSGNVIWSKFLGLPGMDYSIQMRCLEMPDGNYVVVFNQGSMVSSFMSLIKLDPNGNIIMEYNYSGQGIYIERCNSIAVTNDSGLIFTGNYGGEPFLLRVNSQGQPLWCKIYSDTLYEIAGTSVIQTKDNDFIITVSSANYSASTAMIIRTNSSGDTLWTKHLSGYEYIYLSSVTQTSDSNFVLAGAIGNYNTNDQSLLILKFNSVGDTLWSRTYDTGGWNLTGKKIIEAPDGGLSTLCMNSLVTTVFKTDKDGLMNCFQDTSTLMLNQVQINISNDVITIDSTQGITNGNIIANSGISSTSTYCLTLGSVPDLKSMHGISIYPNPASGILHLDYSFPINEISIYGLAGNLILTSKNKTEVDVSSLEPGMYYLLLRSNSGIQSQKFIKD